MWAALILVALTAGAAADETSCACSTGFPPLPAGGFKSISGYAGCIVNYVQFEDPTGAVVFTSGSLSGGEPFSVTCPGNNTITGFSFLCNTGSGPGAFPTPNFASLSTIGGVTCSNGSLPFYSGILNQNVCELADAYTQLGYLDCGADGSALPSCFSEGGACVLDARTHSSCAGTQQCNFGPSPPSAPWSMFAADSRHSSMGAAPGPTSPSVLWTTTLPWHSASVVVGDGDIVYATCDQATVNAFSKTGAPLWQWQNPNGGFMDLYPSIATDGTIYAGQAGFHALNPNGTTQWDVLTSIPVLQSSTIGADGTIYVGSFSFSSQQGLVNAIYPNGTVKWAVDAGSNYSPFFAPTITLDGLAVLASWDNTLYALRVADGSVLWMVTNLAWSHCAASVGLDGTIFCGTSAISPTGALLWSAPSTAPYSSTYVAPADGNIYTVGSDHNVYCLSSTGTVIWSAIVNTASTITLDTASRIFVRNDTHIIALQRSTGALDWIIPVPSQDSSGSGGAAMMSDGTLVYTTFSTGVVFAIGDK